MKKILLLMMVCAAIAAQAQNVTVVKPEVKGYFNMIPAEFTAENRALFLFRGSQYQGLSAEPFELKIMDSSFHDLKTISIPTQTFNTYELVYKEKSVYKRNYEMSGFESLPSEDYSTNGMPMGNDEEVLAYWQQEWGSDARLKEWNADTILVYMANDYGYWNNLVESDDEIYGSCVYYHRTNPKRWASCNVRWIKSYTGEYEAPVKQNEWENIRVLGVDTNLYDVNNFDDEHHSVVVSQTLFNNDDKFEYIKPEYEVRARYTYFQEGYKREVYEPVMTGFSVVQEDGTVLATVKASSEIFIDEYDINVVRSYDGIYILVDEGGYPREEGVTAVYKMNSSGTGIAKVKEMNTMRAYPNPARRSENVNIEIPENVSDGTLIVTNSAGITLQTIKVDGRRQASVSTSRMTPGVYNVTLVEKGRRAQMSRIIVK